MKIKHILKAKEFADILKSGKKVHGKTVSLYIKQDKEQKELSVGVVVSKKFAPLAVRRNYIRRLIYSHFRDHKDSLRRDVKVIVRIARGVGGLKKKPLSQEIRGALTLLTEKARIRT